MPLADPEPLSVGMVCPYSMEVPGGVQNQVLGLARWLQGQGHRVAVCAPGRVDPALLSEYALEGAFTSLGGSVPIRWNRSVARIAAGPETVRALTAWSRGAEIEVLQLHEPFTPSAAGWALALARVPVLATFHAAVPENSWQSSAARGFGTMTGRLRNRIAVATASSGVAAETARRHWGLAAEVLGNGVRVADFETDHRVAGGPVGDRAQITFLGRVDEPRKGWSVLRAALPLVWARRPRVEVVVAGPGGESAGLDPRVHGLGRLEDRARAELLGRTDVFVAPHTGAESFGLVLCEAMAAGARVVASDLPAFREVLGPGVGRLVTPGDPRALAEALLAALELPVDEVDGERARSRDRVRAHDWEVVGPRYAEALHRVRGRG